MPLPRMYSEFASYWPLISDPADYAAEARRWREAHLFVGTYRTLHFTPVRSA